MNRLQGTVGGRRIPRSASEAPLVEDVPRGLADAEHVALMCFPWSGPRCDVDNGAELACHRPTSSVSRAPAARYLPGRISYLETNMYPALGSFSVRIFVCLE